MYLRKYIYWYTIINSRIGMEFRYILFLQDPFGQLTLTVLGDSQAPTYFDAAQNGTIFVRSDLTADSAESYTVR